jgi:hypothetical protein
MQNSGIHQITDTEIASVNGASGGIPSEPTIQDYIDLAAQKAEETLWRLTRGNVSLPPVY